MSPSPARAVSLSVDGPVVWSPNFGVTVAKELERRFPLFSSVLVCLLVAVFPVLFPSHVLLIVFRWPRNMNLAFFLCVIFSSSFVTTIKCNGLSSLMLASSLT